MEQIAVCVNPAKLLASLRYAFTNKYTVVTELMQNARRAKASCVGVDYDGNSQGGIYGGTVCAVSIDVRRCALGVPGMDYPVLLPRSSDYVAKNTVPQVMQEELEKLAADPSSYDPTNAYSDIGYSNLLDTFYPDQGQRQDRQSRGDDDQPPRYV